MGEEEQQQFSYTEEGRKGNWLLKYNLLISNIQRTSPELESIIYILRAVDRIYAAEWVVIMIINYAARIHSFTHALIVLIPVHGQLD